MLLVPLFLFFLIPGILVFHRSRFFFSILLLLGLPAGRVAAQTTDKLDGFGIEANIMGGKIFRHTQRFLGPMPDFCSALDINFLQKTDGRQAWQQRRNYIQWGVGLTYTDYGMKDVYGSCIGMYPNIQLPIIRRKNLEWTFRFGLGLGYVSKRFNRYPDFDTLNNAVSSHINNFSLFSTDIRYRLNEHWDLQAGLNFTHISNAAFRQPNLGINMYAVHIGVRYFPTTSEPAKIKRRLQPLSNRYLVQARVGMALNGAGNGAGPQYPAYLASAFVSKRYASKNKVFVGVDYSYHERIYAFLRNNEILPGEEKQYSWKSAVFVGHEWLMGRGALTLQIGVYLKQAYLRMDPYYQKIGYNYYLIRQENGLLKELYLSAQLKTHKTIAELAEFGFGVSF